MGDLCAVVELVELLPVPVAADGVAVCVAVDSSVAACDGSDGEAEGVCVVVVADVGGDFDFEVAVLEFGVLEVVELLQEFAMVGENQLPAL